MHKISLKEAGLSNEAIIECVRQDIHFIHELLGCYVVDKNLEILKDVSPEVKKEIIHLCKEKTKGLHNEPAVKTESKPEKRKYGKNIAPVHTVDINITPDTFLVELEDLGHISKNTRLALDTNNICTAGQLIDHYKKFKSFRGLRQIGDLKNIEASRLCEALIFRIANPVTETEKNGRSGIFTAENVNKPVLEKLFSLRSHGFRGPVISYFRNEIFTENDPGALAEKLNEINNDPKVIPGVGIKVAADLQAFLEELKKYSNSDQGSSDLDKQILVNSLRKVAWIDDNWLQENDLEFSKPLQILYNLIFNSVSLKDNDIFILENVSTFKITEKHKGLKYEEALEKYNSERGTEIPFSTFKVWINRVKSKFSQVIDDILSGLPELSEKLHVSLGLSEDFELVASERIDELNDTDGTGFSDLFFDLLICALNKEYYSLYGPAKGAFPVPGYLKRSLVKDPEKLDKLLLFLGKALEQKRTKERTFDLGQELADILEPGIGSGYLLSFLKGQNDEIRTESGKVILPATIERRKSLGELVTEIVEENGAPMHYNDIIERFEEKHPEIHLSAYRSLRDAINYSERLTSMGGSSSHYLLKEWQEEYYVGSLKELIIDLLREKQPRHFYEIFKVLSEKRPGLQRPVTVLAILTDLSEIFYHHQGGYYSIMADTSVDKGKTYPRIHAAVYSVIQQNKALLGSLPELLKILKDKYPDLSEIQLEYAVYQYLEK